MEIDIYLMRGSRRSTFVPATAESGDLGPVILDCPDLAAAQKASRQLRGEYGDSVKLLLRVSLIGKVRTDRPEGVTVRAIPRAVASLAADMRLLNIADGLLLVDSTHAEDPALLEAVTRSLSDRGYTVASTISGWVLTCASPATADAPTAAVA
ncbi:hypothetical protein [Nocardia miyunensis]|uniref:hypothetical protein n=1 Tax=Nocardia miyunensis TaxID=282684 RepID=UPI000835BE4D|nr:hypothetical protein [Nocardia miyunensis]